MATCSTCGASNPDGFRFCGTCGVGLAVAPGGRREARKTVTILFADVAGSTSMGERLDPEVVRRLMERYFEAVRPIVERHGGTVEKFIGDAVMAVFGIPTLHEDDALRAVRAAVESREAVAALRDSIADQGLDLEVRIGVETGEVVADAGTSGQAMVTGDAVNTASRLQGAAAPSEILIGEATYRLVRDSVDARPMPPLSLKGKRDPVAAYRLESVAPITASPLSGSETRMVGRAMELAELQGTFERVVRDGRCFLFTVIGAAGVGKSRLIREFIRQVGDRATVVRGRCLPYGEGITYWPIGEIVREVAGIDPGDSRDVAYRKIANLFGDQPDRDVTAERVACAAGLSEGPATRDELAWGVRRLLETLASDRPLIVVLDDLQWADPTLLDLVGSVAEWSRESPILLLCPARPDLLDVRPSWAGGTLGATTMALEPLGATDARALAEDVLDGPVDVAVSQRIVETAEGNPLFVEELIGMLVDDGRLVRDADGWRFAGDSSALDVPDTIHALLAARLDSLPAEERATAERGSVIGRVFEEAAVATITPPQSRDDVPAHLRNLVRRLLLGRFQAEGVYRFRHLLIRDAAYEALPKQERADLHERFADWLEQTSGDRLTEQEELLGYHLEQAHDYRIGLGLADEHTASLARRAGGWLASAGELADARRDVRAAVSLLTRAERLLPQDDPRYWPAVATLGGALTDAGMPLAGLEMLARAVPELRDADPVVSGMARLRHMFAIEALGRSGLREERAELISIICSLPEGTRADRLRAELFDSLGGIYQNRGLMQKALRSCRRGLRYAERSGDQTTRIDTMLGLINLGLRTTTPVGESISMCRSVLAEPGLIPSMRAGALRSLAYLDGLSGRFDDARERWEQARQGFESVGAAASWHGLTLGLIEMMADDPVAAERSFRSSYDAVTPDGTRRDPFLAARLAQAVLALGRIDEADRLVDEAMTIEEAEGWTPTIAFGTRARILALQGRLPEALDIATTNVDRATARGLEELPMLYGGALEDLAFVQTKAGLGDEARTTLEDALDRYERKGYVVGSDRIRRALTTLAA